MPNRPAAARKARRPSANDPRTLVRTHAPRPFRYDRTLGTACTAGNYALSAAVPATQGRRFVPVCRAVSSGRVPLVVNSAAVSAVVEALDAGPTPDRAVLRDAVRALLAALRDQAPGRSVEVRVPPYGAIQCVDGPATHPGYPAQRGRDRSGRPSCGSATGRLSWADAVARRAGHAPAASAPTSPPYLPLWPDAERRCRRWLPDTRATTMAGASRLAAVALWLAGTTPGLRSDSPDPTRVRPIDQRRRSGRCPEATAG